MYNCVQQIDFYFFICVVPNYFRTDVNSYLSTVGLLNNGLNYHLISVFGSQSTGKSTLLNALFGTKFDVMDESARKQTTKGMFLLA